MSLSKFLLASFPYNCYEIGHTWTPYCSQAWLGIWYDVFVRALKLYGLLYLVGQLLSRRYNRRAFFSSLKSTLNSSVFISANFFFYLFFVCVGRKALGRLHLLPATFLAGFFSALVAIYIEKPSRRRILALYMLNLASEMVYRLLRCRSIVRDLPYAEVVMFASSLGSYVYYARKRGYHKDIVPMVLKFLLGQDELKSVGKHLSQNGNVNFQNGETKGIFSKHDITVKQKCDDGAAALKARRNEAKHRSSRCTHERICIAEVTTVALKSGCLGWAVGATISVISNVKRLAKGTSSLLPLLTGSPARRIACFLASLTGIYRLTSCLLVRASHGREDWHGFVAGSVAGLASCAAPSSNISLYLAWKLVELVYLKSAEQNIVPTFSNAAEVLYALCTGIMLYVAIIEPHNLRPQYLKFLDEVSGNMLGRINRYPLDILGHHSSRTFPDFFPLDLNRRFVSRQFLQTILIWT